jgi:5-formyltetrahydrofolate cyclo-ligase
VPLLGFDALGYRIGYGAGFYDRTLQKLRGKRPVLAAGFAFSVQEFAEVPHDENDQRLDWMATENGARQF